MTKKKWTKVFRKGQWTNLGTNLAAIITAIVAFFTLIQIKKQTEYSYRPDVMVKESKEFLYLKYDQKIDNIRDFIWLEQQPRKTDSVLVNQSDLLQLEIVNIGLAAAKELEFEWIFEVDDLTGILEFENLEIDTETQSFEDQARSQLLINNSLQSKSLTHYVEHILPINQSQTTDNIEIFTHYYLLWANALSRICQKDLPYKEKNNIIVEFLETCPDLKLEVKYLDIGQKKYRKTYSIRFIPSIIDMVDHFVYVHLICFEKGNVKSGDQDVHKVKIRNSEEANAQIITLNLQN